MTVLFQSGHDICRFLIDLTANKKRCMSLIPVKQRQGIQPGCKMTVIERKTQSALSKFHDSTLSC